MMKAIGQIFVLAFVCILCPLNNNVSAHSGGTDAYGGHNCYVGSCAGTYHYHNEGYVLEEDYYDQGYEFGSSEAFDNNHGYIISNANNEGQSDGYEVGLAGEIEDISPDAPEWICEDVTFDFRANEDQDYINGVYEGFQENCIELTNNTYAEAYSKSYADGYDAYTDSTEEKPLTESSQDESSSNNSGWIGALLTIGFYGSIALAASWEEISGWWKKHI